MSNVIIIAALAILLTFAIKNTVSHFKGESSCCGGGSRDVKTKPAKLDRVVSTTIKRDIMLGKRVIIAAHGNSLRALVKYFDNMSDDEIVGVNIPTAVPLVYEFDDNMNVLKHYYLGDQEALKAKMEAVANQGKKK